MVRYDDRRDAGRQIAQEVGGLALDDPVVLGLPRGGVPVAVEVAEHLGAPLDVVVVRKVGAPGRSEYGLGAVGEAGVELLDEDRMGRLGVSRPDLEQTIADERRELEERLGRYRGGRSGADVTRRTVVVVDDGVATGVSAEAAGRVLRERGAERVVLAVPVGAPDSIERLRRVYDDVVCLAAPDGFRAVSMYYRDFGQTTDDEVTRILDEHGGRLADHGGGGGGR